MEYTLHARRVYFGRPRYDFVHVRNDNGDVHNPWLARVLAIFKVEVPAGQRHIVAAGFLPLVIVQWLERDVDVIPGTPSYRYLPTPQAVEVEAIIRPVKLLESPTFAADGSHKLCALLYGKSSIHNALFGAHEP